MKTLHALVAVCLLAALAGCATTPAPSPADPSVYRPHAPITYPIPR